VIVRAARSLPAQLAHPRQRAQVVQHLAREVEQRRALELQLEAHAGRDTDHTRIPVGKGVCGTAVATKQDQNVPDVNAVGNYLACNAFTKSELVVLIRRGDHILGQLDIDSDVPDGFGEREHADVKEIADALAVLL